MPSFYTTYDKSVTLLSLIDYPSATTFISLPLQY
jgi:hypothetical protein